MFEIVKCQDVVRVPPEKFNHDLKVVALEELSRKYEGTLNADLGYIVAILDVNVSPSGKILPGDGATYHQAEFTLLTYKPELQEVVEGEVVEIGDFGSFVRVGPVEALLHISQILDDYIVFDGKKGILLGKETQRKLSTGDKVRVRITAVSMGKGGLGGKIGVTMRQPFLGKLEWIEEDVKKLREPAPKPEKKKAVKMEAKKK
ncbi:DNA-directed RNA polymerase [Candidatus Bathyarchaeota archaeon]|nr:MAG: DNA-directed RNA polymerase [Candidatus Bathyarchaeota archaeon]